MTVKREDQAKDKTTADTDSKPEGMQVGIIVLAVMGGLLVLLIALQMC
jgi:hypothetical protein